MTIGDKSENNNDDGERAIFRAARRRRRARDVPQESIEECGVA